VSTTFAGHDGGPCRSLTKQDLALMDIPGMAKLVEPIVYVIKSSMILLYGKHRNGSPATAKNTAVEIDKNQPHILKYSVDTGHTGGTCATVCQAIELWVLKCATNKELLALTLQLFHSFLSVELHHDRWYVVWVHKTGNPIA
jgi:hypothetical protein